MIPFIQFLRPDGRQKAIEIERSPEIEKQAQMLINAGCRFEIEELSNGFVSMEVVRPSDDPDGDPEILSSASCWNGSKVPLFVDQLVLAAVAALNSSVAFSA